MLDEAIETLKLENKYPWNRENSKLRKAVRLGIEAMERIRVIRDNPIDGVKDYEYYAGLLPSETRGIRMEDIGAGFTEEELADLRHNACDDTIG